MLGAFLAVVLVIPQATANTTVTLGSIRRDLTGDGVPEVLNLTAVGPSIANLKVTFTIQSSGRLLYTTTWRLTRASFDGRRRLSDADLRTRLNEYGSWFFAESKFMSPEGFVAMLRASAPGHVSRIPEAIVHDLTPAADPPRARKIWEQIQAAGLTVFQFSVGGDALTVIAWSAADQRFVRLLECC